MTDKDYGYEPSASWPSAAPGRIEQPYSQPAGPWGPAGHDDPNRYWPPSPYGAPPEPSRPGKKKKLVLLLGTVALAGILTGVGVAAIIHSGSKGNGNSPSVSTGGGSASSARQSAKAIAAFNSTMSTALKASSFHYVSTVKSAGDSSQTTGDAGLTTGRQDIVTSGTNFGPTKFTVLVIGTACYFQGDSEAMQQNLDLSAAVAQAHAGQWISLAPTDSPYSSVYAAVTTQSALSDNVNFTPRAVTSKVLAGQKVKVITGTDGALTAQMVVSVPTGLPMSYTAHGSTGGVTESVSVDFSKFGEKVSETAPPNSIQFSTFSTTSGASPKAS